MLSRKTSRITGFSQYIRHTVLEGHYHLTSWAPKVKAGLWVDDWTKLTYFSFFSEIIEPSNVRYGWKQGSCCLKTSTCVALFVFSILCSLGFAVSLLTQCFPLPYLNVPALCSWWINLLCRKVHCKSPLLSSALPLFHRLQAHCSLSFFLENIMHITEMLLRGLDFSLIPFLTFQLLLYLQLLKVTQSLFYLELLIAFNSFASVCTLCTPKLQSLAMIAFCLWSLPLSVTSGH